jgi:hypothetical protein
MAILKRVPRQTFVRFEAAEPNFYWQMDSGHVPLSAGTRLHPLFGGLRRKSA